MFGVGSVGLSTVVAAAISGCSPIIAVDLRPARLALGARSGRNAHAECGQPRPGAGDPRGDQLWGRLRARHNGPTGDHPPGGGAAGSFGTCGMYRGRAGGNLVGHARNGRSWSISRILDRKEADADPTTRAVASPEPRGAGGFATHRRRVRANVSIRCVGQLRCSRWHALVYLSTQRMRSGLRSGTTVADLVARFNRHGLAAIRIARGRGATNRPM